jgi:hypothetical protein
VCGGRGAGAPHAHAGPSSSRRGPDKMPLPRLPQRATLLILVVEAVGPVVALKAPLTWLSVGDGPGQALLAGTPVAVADEPLPPLTEARLLPAIGAESKQAVRLPVLQQGNGSIMLGLPTSFSLHAWRLQLCAEADCTTPVPVFDPDVMWTSCDGSACAAGGTLRVFGRRLAFDKDTCRPYNSTQPIFGSELQARLGLESATQATSPTHRRSFGSPRLVSTSTVQLKAARQTCYDATFALPTDLAPGQYHISFANSVGGQLGGFHQPSQPDLRVINVIAPWRRGTTVIRPSGMTGSAIIKALKAAAAHNDGAIVQLGPGTYHLKAGDTLVVGNSVTLRGAGTSHTVLEWEQQTLATSATRKHQALIHGENINDAGWTLEDLSVVAPQVRNQLT